MEGEDRSLLKEKVLRIDMNNMKTTVKDHNKWRTIVPFDGQGSK